jgi:hypothetical protein
MHLICNIEGRSRNNCCRKKAIPYTFLCVCVCVCVCVVSVRVREWWVCECVSVRFCVCGYGFVCMESGMCLRACSLANPACNPPP